MNEIKMSIALAVTASTLFLAACSTTQQAANGDNENLQRVTSEVASAGPWNIRVVPSRQTAYSGGARELFNKNCASCHSQDGRAQTPIARQRHVRDLSGSRLTDDVIIEQILEGTHNKANTFKMPPFKEKLSRAEIESLVPVVKAFRPAPRKQTDQADGRPRLAGMVNCFYGQFAVLETFDSSGEYFILREKESHAGVTLLRFRPKKGMVELHVGGTNPIVNLILDGWAASHPRGSGLSGFLDRLSIALNNAPQKIELTEVNTDLVLFLYSQLTGCTLIRSPRLPAASFDLAFGATGPESAAHRLKMALKSKGIATIEDGEKFIQVVPASEAASVRPHSSEIKALAGKRSRPEVFPGGVFINFPNTQLTEVVKLYADLTGRELDRTGQLPVQDLKVTFTTQTALSTAECVYALETLLRWHGLKVVPMGGVSFKVIGI
jgi:mono/diheme cytochrome c family protein